MFLKCRKSGISNCLKPYHIINLSIFLTFRHLETFHSYTCFLFSEQDTELIKSEAGRPKNSCLSGSRQPGYLCIRA